MRKEENKIRRMAASSAFGWKNLSLYMGKSGGHMKTISIYICVIVGMFACVIVPIMFAGVKHFEQNASPRIESPSWDDPRFAAFVYDVVSIKLHKEDPNATSVIMGGGETPDGYSAKNIPLRGMIGAAYRTDHIQIADGAPRWLADERYDVEAKMDPSVNDALQKLSPADCKLARQHMLRALLQDRLKLAVHMESKEVSVYDPVVAKNGPKLKETTDPNSPHGGSFHAAEGGTVMESRGMSITSLLGQFTILMHRPVFDKTQLTGTYDFTLKFTSDRNISMVQPGADTPPTPDTNLPSFAIAVEEQLGLKFVSAKGLMDVIVIDHVERPSAN